MSPQMTGKQQPIKCKHGVGPIAACEVCTPNLIEALDIGGDRTLENDGNGNSDLRKARTARFHINKEPTDDGLAKFLREVASRLQAAEEVIAAAATYRGLSKDLDDNGPQIAAGDALDEALRRAASWGKDSISDKG